MNATPLLRAMLRDLVRVERAKISLVTALRNTIGVAAPLAWGAASGHLLAGLTMCIGALNAAFSDRPGPYRRRAGHMLLSGLCGAISVFAGSATGANDVAAVALAASWGFGGGLLVALGPAATQIGLTAIVLLLVFAGQPQAPDHAAAAAGLVLTGAALQTLLSVAAWPVLPFGPQRAALATVFRQLAAFIRAPSDPANAPPATGAITEARTTMSTVDSAYGADGETLRTLLDEAERIRLDVLALDDAAHQLRDQADAAALRGWVDAAMEAAGDVLEALAGELAIGPGHPARDLSAPLGRIEAATLALQRRATDRPGATPAVAMLLAHVEALGGQLRAAARLATEAGSAPAEPASRVTVPRPPHLRLRAPLAILRANLTLRSAACRHALRLAVCLAAADALARGVAMPRAYWVPMTAAIVLKPDFGATFTRGLGRTAGTALGLALATALVSSAQGALAGRVAIVAACVFTLRSLGAANYGLLVGAVTGLVVVLTSFAGIPPDTTIVERAIATLAGGALALGAYALWPTWERVQTPALLAGLLDAYRRYFATVMAGYVDPGRRDPGGLDAARMAARVARTNAEASVDRMRDEPARSARELDRAVGVLAHSHRFVHGVMALEAGLYHDQRQDPAPSTAPRTLNHDVDATLRTFNADVDTTLRALAAALRDSSPLPATLPNLRADQRDLPGRLPQESDEDDPLSRARLALLAAETDRVTDSLNTLAGLLRGVGRADLAPS